jgi:hypothetical protein
MLLNDGTYKKPDKQKGILYLSTKPQTPTPHIITLQEKIKVKGQKYCGKKVSNKDKSMLMNGKFNSI